MNRKSASSASGSSAVAERAKAVARAARAWRDPECRARAEAVEQTLQAPNRFTEEALAFALNAATHRLTADALRAWLAGRPVAAAGPSARAVSVLPGGGTPLAGLGAALAVLLVGHRCVLCPPGASPRLVAAFLQAVGEETAGGAWPGVTVAGEAEEATGQSAAAIGDAQREERAAFEQRCEAAGLPPERRHWQSATFSVAVLDGNEGEEAREGLAEDAWLCEGQGRSSVRLVWAPAGTAPDPYLEAMAHFRAVFPAHEDTPGALRMQQAFLEAQGQAHARGEGLEFLMSRGAPEVQTPGHLRWAEYDALPEVSDWLESNAPQVHAVAARPSVAERLPAATALEPGTTHRQGPLGAPGAGAVLDFATRL